MPCFDIATQLTKLATRVSHKGRRQLKQKCISEALERLVAIATPEDASAKVKNPGRRVLGGKIIFDWPEDLLD